MENINVNMLYSKIHRATVTCANLDYEGSITIDKDLMDNANLIPNQQVDVYNITNGERFTTYVIEGQSMSGKIEVNGAAAHLVEEGDMVIICSYTSMPLPEARNWSPSVVFVDENNRVKDIREETESTTAA